MQPSGDGQRPLSPEQSALRAPKPARDLTRLFSPQSIAVIGASAREGSVGNAVFRNLLLGGYQGVLYPVNPRVHSTMAVRTYPTVSGIGEPVELAVIIIPPRQAVEVLDECAAAGVKHAIVISAGFKEVGPEGARLEEELKARAEAHGISLLGPNCLGLINTDPAVSMNATFARRMPEPGNLAFISQSGALCTAILDYAAGQGIGFSKFISFGNKADVNEIDLLRYLSQDPLTEVILMYLEDLSNGWEFIQLAREVAGEGPHPKPILAIKTGRTPQGAAAAASHTGSLAGSDDVYDAIFAQAGVMRVDTVEDLFNFALAFAREPIPKGNRVAIITNAGGPGILAADACARYDLELAQLQPETTTQLRERLPPTASLRNPVDVIGDARHDRYEAALKPLLADPGVDAAVVIVTPQNMTDLEAIAEVVWQAARGQEKPVLGAFMGAHDIAGSAEILRRHGIPQYAFPESAVRSLAMMAQYGRWRARPITGEQQFPVDHERARRVVERALQQGRMELPETEALEMLSAYGFPIPAYRLARTAAEAAEAAAAIGFPVVMKIASPDILHKTEVQGVRLGIESSEEARSVFAEMVERARAARPHADLWGCTVQATAAPGREVILGARRDPKFGPVLMFGLGGIYAEVLKDVSFRLAPIRARSAERMVRSIRARALLEGARGQPPADIPTVVECLERLSQFVMAFPEVQEMDINPLIVYPEGHGAAVVDARIILGAAEPDAVTYAPEPAAVEGA